MQPYLSIIIPAYNEETRIIKSLQTAVNYLKLNNFDYEIIVVDDGSTDNTVNIVDNFGFGVRIVSLGANIGKGAAVKQGMLESKGKYRFFSDADFSTPVYELPKILKRLESGVDVCIGSRAIDRSMVKKHQPIYRETMGKIFNKFVQLFVLKGITDTQCGFKGFRDYAAQELFSNSKITGFSFDVELLYLSSKFGFKVEQVPVEWYNDKRSTVNPVKDSLNMIIELLKIKKIHSGK
jgi:dolichyl-phosphate beta-glucosyltransferase